MITIGMATIRDFDGPYFTIRHLTAQHHNIKEDIEFVVIDNDPSWEYSNDLKSYCKTVDGGRFSCRYIPFNESRGTSATRSMLFDVAKTDHVMVMDSHVILYPEALPALINYFRDNPLSEDILSGPLVYDNGITNHTHYNMQWRSEMWGTWGSVWELDGKYFTIVETDLNDIRQFNVEIDSKFANYPSDTKLALPMQLVPKPQLGKPCYQARFEDLPIMETYGYHQRLRDAGAIEVTFDSHPDAIIETPGHGLGMFACRRDAFPGFNEHHHGFGGEELYLHEKFRKNGGKSLMLPALRWGHRFGHRGVSRYPVMLRDKIRNYVNEFIEMGWDLSEVRAHFESTFKRDTNGGRVTEEKVWNWIVENRKSTDNYPWMLPHSVAPKFERVEDPYLAAEQNQRDLNQHMASLRKFAAKSKVVFELSDRRESTIAFIKALSDEGSTLEAVYSVQSEKDHPLIQQMLESVPEGKKVVLLSPSDDSIPWDKNTDFVFLDTKHDYKSVKKQIEQFGKKSNRFLAFHDTISFGEKYNNERGFMYAVRELLREEKDWQAIFHDEKQHGLMILSKNHDDRPKIKATAKQMAGSFMSAIGNYIKGGFENVSKEDYEARMETCLTCIHRRGGGCSICGCNLQVKATMKNNKCPVELWPELTEE